MTNVPDITIEKLAILVTNGEIGGLLYAIVALDSGKYKTTEDVIVHLKERIAALTKTKNSYTNE